MFSHGRADLISLLSRLARDSSPPRPFSSRADESGDSIITGNRVGKNAEEKFTGISFCFASLYYYYFNSWHQNSRTTIPINESITDPSRMILG